MSGLQRAFKAEDLFLGVLDPVTLTVSVLALLASAASAIATWRTNSRQGQHQERLVNLETAREQGRQRLARSAEDELAARGLERDQDRALFNLPPNPKDA